MSKHLRFLLSASFVIVAAMPGCGVAHAQQARLVQQDPILGKQYHKQQYVITEGKLCPIDRFGSREYHKPCMVVDKK